MKEIVLRACELSVGYGREPVLRGVSFSVHPGEILTLIGPNGAGKSTLLNTLSGRLAPLAGTVFLDGEALSEMGENAERVRAELMSCREVVATGRYPYTGQLGILSERDHEAVLEALALVHGTELAELSFSELSDGQRQRVMLARAICQEPELLLLDEPTSYLDVRHKLEFLTTLRALAREKGIAVVMSLHELDCAARVSDALLCVRDGRLDRVGPPGEILNSAYIETLYGMEKGSYGAFFGSPGDEGFFQNRSCKFFPCHSGVEEAAFNCLFCYCPLYALGEKCGGNFHYTGAGVKSCVDCAFPHRRENYEKLLARWPELMTLAGKKNDGV